MQEKKSIKERIFSKETLKAIFCVAILGLLIFLVVIASEIADELGVSDSQSLYSYDLRKIEENQSELYEEVSEINEKLDKNNY